MRKSMSKSRAGHLNIETYQLWIPPYFCIILNTSMSRDWLIKRDLEVRPLNSPRGEYAEERAKQEVCVIFRDIVRRTSFIGTLLFGRS
jgi:hypothetical protein